MIPFETEFPIRMSDHRAFLAQVIVWLRGTTYARILSEADERELESDHAALRKADGEALTLRVLREGEVIRAAGFRYDMPDAAGGRNWRTEAVLSWDRPGSDAALLRLRTVCMPTRAGAVLERPKKPFFVKNLLKDRLGLDDGLLPVTGEPVRLGSGAEGLDLAGLAMSGEATVHLPVVYLSAPANRADGLSEAQINRLAFELGGVAHVLVEPDRAFSFELRDRMEGRNPYGGTVGIAVPGLGLVRRIWLGGLVPDAAALQDWVHDTAIAQRSAMPAKGWDWTQLQDEALREQRKRAQDKPDKGALTFEDATALYDEEIANLQERIADLQRDLEAERMAERETRDIGGAAALPAGTIPEIYPGELTDRLRTAARRALDAADRDGLDARSHAVLTAFLATQPEAPGRTELIADIREVTKSGRRMADKVERLLSHHGYVKKSDNGHPRLEAAAGFVGLGTLTLSKSPSDHRAPDNLKQQILKALGL